MDKTAFLRTSLDLLYYSGAARALEGICRGMGAIFMLHHVRPGGGQRGGFAPNSGLEVTPEFLDAAIAHVARRGYDLLSLEGAVARLVDGNGSAQPFAVFTLDDGYRDNLVHAWPVFRRQRCPFTIFVAPAITDGRCELWWRGLEAVLAKVRRIDVSIAGEPVGLETVTDLQKQAAYERLYWPVRRLPEHEQRRWIREFCGSHGVEVDALCRREAMTWDEVRQISADPLCSIGAHTVHHYAVAKLPPLDVIAEAAGSRERIAQEIGRRPALFAYPYGDEASAGPRDFELLREAGFTAAVTTRKGLIFGAHRHHLTALPRVSLNGGFQTLRHLDVLMSGSAFALWNGFRLVKAA